MDATYAATVTGPHRPMLWRFFADKIASLGGTPTAESRPVPVATGPKKTPQDVFATEKKAMAEYKKRAEPAAKFRDRGSATHLQTIVADDTSHYEETEKTLRGW